jgi:K+-transporting ATPase ATPase C chain
MLSVALRIFFGLTFLTGVVYPLLITLLAQVFFNTPANGSFISVNDHVVGSQLIGQEFSDNKYFWSRPSAVNYLPMPSGGSNLGPMNHTLKEEVDTRAAKIIKAHPGAAFKDIPSDMLYASGSGIDPHISLKAALFQFDRVAKARNFNEETKEHVLALIIAQSKWKVDQFLVDSYVNVLELNMSLDELK